MAARQHHYIPRFFLEGFVDADGFVHVFDLLEARQWKAKPNGAARIRDFYRVENPDLDPNEVETGLSRIEHELAPAIMRLRQDRVLPPEGTEDFARIANLIALLAARVPAAIDTFANPLAKVGDRLVGLILQSPERYESHLAQRREEGEDVSGAPSWAQMKEMYESGAFKVEVTQDYRVAIMLQSMQIILPWLSGRNWALISTDEVSSTGPFVCSDRPVCLSWTKRMLPIYSPGWGTRNTQMLLPLTGDLTIWSAYEPGDPLVTADASQVATVNSLSLRQADRFLFSPEPTFSFLGRGGRIVDSAEMLQMRRTAIAEESEGPDPHQEEEK